MLSLSELNVGLRADFDEARPIFVRPRAVRVGAPTGAGTIASVAIHLLMLAFVVSLAKLSTPPPPRTLFVAPRLVSVVYLPSAPLEMPRVLPAPKSAPKPVDTPEPRPLLPAPVRPIEVASTAAAAPPRVIAPPETPRPAPPTPAPPTPTVGLFSEAVAVARAPQPVRQVESAGFDAPVKQTQESRLGQATIGAFDSAAAGGQQQKGGTTNTGAVVADSGFGRPSSAAPPTEQGRVIRETGFGDATSREQPRSAQPPTEVKQAGFGNAVAANDSRRAAAPPPPPAITPVEVLFKPAPTYTDQARKLGIEGDVILEVDFLSSGALRVIRVVRGLGHGLDEAAVKAAEQIRFKPAQDRGRPVDSRNTVSIVFRLA